MSVHWYILMLCWLVDVEPGRPMSNVVFHLLVTLSLVLEEVKQWSGDGPRAGMSYYGLSGPGSSGPVGGLPGEWIE